MARPSSTAPRGAARRSMSTATIPYLSRRALPVCSGAAAAPFGSGYNYVDLTEAGGDLGFAHAVRLYWLLERVSFSPSGTATRLFDGATSSYAATHSGPAPSTSGLTGYQVYGNIIANHTPQGSSTQPVEPAFRICYGKNASSFAEALVVFSGIYPSDTGSVGLAVCFAGGRWRLYYNFEFFENAFGALLIRNPARFSTHVIVASGTLVLDGLTLEWKAGILPAIAANYSTTGLGLMVTPEFWAF